VMKYFHYEIHQELVNADYLHENGFFVGNSQICLKNELNFLLNIL
jgi:CDP-6-deoxy-D-xylo-4-hexulose-3-dehydrase